MRILLLRHGQTHGNLSSRIQGSDDSLTDLGRSQAALLGPHLAATYAIDHLVSSSLSRAHETAMIVNESLGMPISLDLRFAEIMAGDAVGMLWEEWRAAYPELADVWSWDVRHADSAWVGGESGRDLCSRAFAAFDELIDRYRNTDDTLALVTHGGVIAWLAARMNDDDLEYWPGPYSDISNCSVTEVEVSRSGGARIERWNITDHFNDTYAPDISPVIPPVSSERASS